MSIINKLKTIKNQLPQIFDSEEDVIYDRFTDLAFFKLFLDENGDEDIVEKWCEFTGTQPGWTAEQIYEIDDNDKIYHPQNSYFDRFLPNYYSYKKKNLRQHLVIRAKKTFKIFLIYLRKLNMRKIMLSSTDYNNLLNIRFINYVIKYEPIEIDIFKELKRNKKDLQVKKLHDILKNKYKYLRLTSAKNTLISKGLRFLGRFNPNLFKLKTVTIEYEEPQNIMTRWESRSNLTNKRFYFSVKIPIKYQEEKIFNKTYKKNRIITGNQNFDYYDFDSFNWKFNSNILKNNLNTIE
ncbi:MAG: hypothetical protein GF329_11280, partial [Candidatus Lokiarchaeota archaeon]|nr:hypothetical protein [Candidatus Lokiarchaeota archaeon]